MEKFIVGRDDFIYEAWPDVVLTDSGKKAQKKFSRAARNAAPGEFFFSPFSHLKLILFFCQTV